MKIGILTFHCAHNYGAVLQCYATQEFLRSKGYDVEIINYRPDYLLEPYRLLKKRIRYRGFVRFIKDIIQELIIFPTRYQHWKGFRRFINQRLLLSQPIDDNSLISADYDVYLVGSDQIWNPNITQGFDKAYFCDFSFEKGTKKYIAYAASMEAKSLDFEKERFYRRQLKRFDAISVREENLMKMLSPLIDMPVRHVLDPTLMVPVSIWDKFHTKSIISEKFVLVYQVIPDDNTLRIANHIANQISAKVVNVVANMSNISFYTRHSHQNATPEDFISILRNAACVVTTSFHGTAFSLIFNRPFYTLKLNKGWDERSMSLLNQLNLRDRLVDVISDPEFTEIDYSKVNPVLDALRQESQDFLIKALLTNLR